MRTDSGVGDLEDPPELPLWTIRTEHRETRVYEVAARSREEAIAAWLERLGDPDEILDDDENLLGAELAE